MVVVEVLVVVVVVDFYRASDARAWPRQGPCSMPCAQAVCVMCRDFAACVRVWLCRWWTRMDETIAFGTCFGVKPCALCVVSLQHVSMRHLRHLPKAAWYTCYIVVQQKGTEIALVQNQRQHIYLLNMNQQALSQYIALRCNHRFKLDIKQITTYIHTFANAPSHLKIVLLLCYTLKDRTLEMCAGRNLLERERKETLSRLKKIFLFPVFFCFFSLLERVFPFFSIFLWINNPIFRCSFLVFSSFHLSKPVPCFLKSLNLAI